MTKRFVLSALLCIAVIPGLVGADSTGEREALARLSHELAALEPLIRAAETQVDGKTGQSVCSLQNPAESFKITGGVRQ